MPTASVSQTSQGPITIPVYSIALSITTAAMIGAGATISVCPVSWAPRIPVQQLAPSAVVNLTGVWGAAIEH
eukprot:11213474-Lingulodinium_polyedra.AAC.1